jgi:hypothetical protein
MMHYGILAALIATASAARAPAKPRYETTQDANTFTDIGRCEDLQNVADDDAALRRIHAAHHAGRYTVWRQGTIVTVAGGNIHRDDFVMAKDRNGRLGCISPSWLRPLR